MMCPISQSTNDGVRKWILLVKSPKPDLLQTDTLFNPCRYVSGSGVRNVVLWPQSYGNLLSCVAWGFCLWESVSSARCLSHGWAFTWHLTAPVNPGARWWLMYEFTLKPFPQLVLKCVLSTLPSPYFHENCKNTITFKTYSFISALIKTGQQIPKGGGTFLVRQEPCGYTQVAHTTLISLENNANSLLSQFFLEKSCSRTVPLL